MDDAHQHLGVRVVGWILVVVLCAAFALYVWASEGYGDPEPTWDTVPIGARCQTLGTEERTYDGRAVYCVSFPHYGIQIWSWSEADLAAPVPAPADPREAQIRVCMHQSGLDQRKGAGGFARYVGADGA